MDAPNAPSTRNHRATRVETMPPRASRGCRPFLPAFLLITIPTLSISLPAAGQATAEQQAKAAEQARAAAAPADAGTKLYNRLCASCHGVNGDGAGPSARFLYPRPRNFRREQFRMVSTANLVPSDDDLLRTLDRGMPGSSMFSFAHLSLDDRKALVAHVRQLVRKGLEDRFKQEAAEFGEEPDLEAMAEIVQERTQPGPALELPKTWPADDAASIARGRELYVKASCAACHGEKGRGDGIQVQKDEMDMPIRPRDYTQGIFKGGRDREALYARIALGVPGTPMPSTPALSPEETADLVHFIQSLSSPETETRVVHKRQTLPASKAESPLAEVIPDSAWANIPATPIVVSPLWWRDDADPDLRAQALHDGKNLAVRLSWNDATPNTRAIHTTEFPDMAAIQLFQGPGQNEPFLGMGANAEPVAVWLWNAAAQADAKKFADVDTVYPNMIVDFYPDETPGDSPGPHPTSRQPKDFLTAWAAGNQRSDPTRLLAGSDLLAEGPGSATLRPPIAQNVRAQGTWNAGRWTVVLHAPLDNPAEGKISIAFALWEGAQRDRNGQKQVSIWHDLSLSRP